eukprot:GHRR01031630.1.p2 GENE.GHRR01031630.1~~GHRR01031630.1.p2  ORF type:complete len:128 (+),score=9.52 GHRR01031630.1:593-976(+)
MLGLNLLPGSSSSISYWARTLSTLYRCCLLALAASANYKEHVVKVAVCLTGRCLIIVQGCVKGPIAGSKIAPPSLELNRVAQGLKANNRIRCFTHSEKKSVSCVSISLASVFCDKSLALHCMQHYHT